jgi:hypothetical protein
MPYKYPEDQKTYNIFSYLRSRDYRILKATQYAKNNRESYNEYQRVWQLKHKWKNIERYRHMNNIHSKIYYLKNKIKKLNKTESVIG